MALVKRNIWLLFFIILLIGGIIFGVLSYFKYQEIHNAYKTENENIAKLVANSSKTYFSQLEMLLKILGDQLSKEKDMYNAVVSKRIFSKLIKMDKSIAGFGLVKPNGEYIMFSGDIRQIQMSPNLLKQEESKESFKEALNSKYMVLGRTYYFEPLGALIIPARKAIRDNTGKTLAIMTVAVNVEKIEFLNTDILFSEENVIILSRNSDLYKQLIISKKFNTNNETLYSTPFPTKVKDIIQYVAKRYGVSENTVKSLNFSFTLEMVPDYEKNSGGSRIYITSSTFVDKYNLWVTSQFPDEKIKNSFISVISIYFIIFIGVYTLLFIMFRYINGFEEKKKESLKFQATHDALTQLPNRQYFLNMTESWFDNKEDIYSVMFIDLDNFKDTNDVFGHDIGDLVLQQVANRLREIVLKDDIIIRHGGDEFLILSKITNKKRLRKYSEEIIEELSRTYKARELNILLGASIGIALSQDSGKTPAEVISCADVALHEAKKKKNTYTIYEEKLKNILLAKLEIENQMKQALKHNEFYMAYQPQVNADGTLYGVEALIRWNNKKLGFIPPDKFIPLAENSGFITFLGNFILDTVLEEMYELQKKIGIEFQVSINISVKQFMESDFYDNVLNKISKVGINPKKVTLEITESLYMHDIEYIIKLLKRFREVGIKISMDDFGTGYSSLSILNKLLIDELKIDKQFVDNILENESSSQMIQSIINIGEAYGFHLLAEGTETKEQIEMLKSLGCKTYQGYYYSKPLKKKELEEYINNH